MDVPGTADVWPSSLVTARSAWGVKVSVSVPPVGVPPGGVTVAVLTRVPVAFGSMAAVKWKARVAPGGGGAVGGRAAVPLAGPVALRRPVSRTKVQGALVTPAGSGSDSVAPVAVLGPALLTVMV